MKARSTRLAVETLEDRCVPATIAYADFNKDGLLDMAAVTNSTTITVSLAKSDGSYTVSAILTVPKSKPINLINVGDFDHDGDLDINAPGQTSEGNARYTHTWLGNGDGTFSSRITEQWLWKGTKWAV